jgi:MraZ protein
LFARRYDCTLDSASKLSLPSLFCKDLQKLPSRSLYLFSSTGGCLMVYPEDLLKEKIEKLKASPIEEEGQLIQDLIKYSPTVAQLDDRGRLYIPADLRRRSGIVRGVVVTGMHDHIEVWDSQIFRDALECLTVDAETIDKICAEFGLDITPQK